MFQWYESIVIKILEVSFIYMLEEIINYSVYYGNKICRALYEMEWSCSPVHIPLDQK